MKYQPLTLRTEMEWRVCADLPDHEVSECGDVRRRNDPGVHQAGMRLRGFIDADGYLCYGMRNETEKHVRAHVLVAKAFIGKPPEDGQRYEVAHNNGSRICNNYWNLRWATRQENSDDRIIHKTACAGVKNGRATIADDDVHYIRRRYREIKNQRGDVSELDRKFNMSRSAIIRIARGQSWAHVPWLEDDGDCTTHRNRTPKQQATDFLCANDRFAVVAGTSIPHKTRKREDGSPDTTAVRYKLENEQWYHLGNKALAMLPEGYPRWKDMKA